MKKYNIATAPRMATFHWTQREPMTWHQLIDWLEPDSPDDQKDCGGYVLGELRRTPVRHPGKTKNCTGLHRSRDGVVSRSVLVLDADNATADFVNDSAVELGCALAFYTTWRHTPEKPRYRLLAPLSDDVSPEEYRLIADAVMHELGLEQFDKGSAEPERLMLKPSREGDNEHDYRVIPGEPLDVAEWLKRAHDLPVTDEPEPVHTEGPSYDDFSWREQQVVNADLQRQIDYWRNIWDEAVEWPEGQRDDKDRGWEALARDFAWAAARWAATPWTGLDEDAARDIFKEVLPDVVAAEPKCAGKWHDGIVAKAEARPIDPPPWAQDFEPVAAEEDDASPEVATGLLARFQRLDLSKLLDPDRPPREYVVEPMIMAGTSVALVAPAGHRKSLLLLGLALAVARGDETFANMTIPRARRVLYLDMENTEDDLSERLLSFGVAHGDQIDQFILVNLPSMEPLDTAKGGSDFTQVVDAYGLKPGDLVVLDSYQRITQAGENDSDTTRGYFRHTGVQLKARGLTVIRTDNTGKDVKKGARGSSGKRDDVDVEYLLESKGDYIEIATGKVRQRGVSALTLLVKSEDDRTSFTSSVRSPIKTAVQECVATLDRLGVPDRAGYRKAMDALMEDDPDVPTREVLRKAVKIRQDRDDAAARDFPEVPLETAPLQNGAVVEGQPRAVGRRGTARSGVVGRNR